MFDLQQTKVKDLINFRQSLSNSKRGESSHNRSEWRQYRDRQVWSKCPFRVRFYRSCRVTENKDESNKDDSRDKTEL